MRFLIDAHLPRSMWVALALAISLCVLTVRPAAAADKNTQVIGDAVYLKPQRHVEVEPFATSGRGEAGSAQPAQ